jgi:hypothetical protein
VEFYAKSRATDGGIDIRIIQSPHTLFRVSRESRAVALKKYSLQLGASTGLANSRVDPKEDLVCFPWIRQYYQGSRLFRKSIWSEEALNLEKIAIDSRAWHPWTIAEVLHTFKCLKELVLIVHPAHSISCRYTLEGNHATDLALENYPSITRYHIELDDWWLTHGGMEGGKWAKPKLVGMKLVYDGGKCCLH